MLSCASTGARPRIALTPGEPAGIGPDLVLQIAQEPWPAALIAIGDPELLRSRAVLLGLPLTLREVHDTEALPAHSPGTLNLIPVALAQPARCGALDPANAAPVLETLARACRGCLDRHFDAMVTAPVHKGVINAAGIRFSGHTEYLAERCGAPLPVMMLCAERLRVALVTTHVPLREVSALITADRVERVLRVLLHDLSVRLHCVRPRVAVCGLNPHAGEGGHLGREEIEHIEPAIRRLQSEGYRVEGPLAADTVFIDSALEGLDAVLAMYHDQGLPVLKQRGFGQAINMTLGLPILRTSVDHGTALALAGTGQADAGSLRAALGTAIALAS